ncbi:acylneuraminate cytidylyltransferase [Microbacterium indicum]|uniref:acylneuraminate cytidylyltransferase n=1 Tax=Microbacterium indicum TaxID=358100 RepID=UPI00048B239A|nr:acylneuraminate cytidylyltransferase [Microbacterium indicum]
MTGPETVAIIPARGGSKGVPRKNVLPVAGIPLVARAVRAALAAGIRHVYVSTDDPEIAAVARAAGGDVVDRPADIAGDTATSEAAILHAMDAIAATGVKIGSVAFLQATSPFIPSAALAEAVRMVASGEYDSAFSAYETYGFLWGRDGGSAVAINHDASFRPRRQDREPHFMETGAFYVLDAAGFREAKFRFFGRTGIVEVPENSAVEIDNLFEFEMAGALAPLVEGSAEILPVDAVVTDFDGVHTDDAAVVDGTGLESVRVSRGDGMGVSLLRKAGVPLLILSTETNVVVRARADKLQVPVIHGVGDKAAVLTRWAEENGVDLAKTAYVGNDVNDLPAMLLVGWPIAVADARPEVKRAARVILRSAGGHGAVREVADRVLAGR